VIDGYDEAPLCSSFASGSFDIDVIFHVHCTKPVWCVTAEVDRKIIQVQENKLERKQKRGTSVTGTTEEQQGQ